MVDSALIFGVTGQDGYYLREKCREHGVAVVGAARSVEADIRADVGDYDQVERLVRTLEPAYVFQLAANSTTRHEATLENHRTIATGTLNVLEAVSRHSPTARVFIAGSAVQFHNAGKAISERDTFEASSGYSLARIHAAYAARYYRSFGVKTYVGYLFHHESPYRKTGHVSQIVATAAAKASIGSSEVLELGDLDVEKEWTFAGDVAHAIWLLVNQELVWEATIGSGETHSIEDWVKACFGVVGHDWRLHVREKRDFVPEYKRLVSNPSTLKGLGWQPRVSFDELANIMVWRALEELCEPKSNCS